MAPVTDALREAHDMLVAAAALPEMLVSVAVLLSRLPHARLDVSKGSPVFFSGEPADCKPTDDFWAKLIELGLPKLAAHCQHRPFKVTIGPDPKPPKVDNALPKIALEGAPTRHPNMYDAWLLVRRVPVRYMKYLIAYRVKAIIIDADLDFDVPLDELQLLAEGRCPKMDTVMRTIGKLKRRRVADPDMFPIIRKGKPIIGTHPAMLTFVKQDDGTVQAMCPVRTKQWKAYPWPRDAGLSTELLKVLCVAAVQEPPVKIKDVHFHPYLIVEPSLSRSHTRSRVEGLMDLDIPADRTKRRRQLCKALIATIKGLRKIHVDYLMTADWAIVTTVVGPNKTVLESIKSYSE